MWVRRNVAYNTSTPEAALEALLGDRQAEVRAAAVTNDTTPVALAAGRVRDRSLKVRQRIAWRSGVSADVLAALAADPKEQVRRHAARNEQTPTETYWTNWPQIHACRCAAGSPTTLPRRRPLCRLLAGDEDRWPRTGAVINRSAPAELLAELATDPDPRMTRTASPTTSARLRSCSRRWPATKTGTCVTVWRRTRPRPPSSWRASPATTVGWVRRSVCGNDKTPRHIVDALAADPDYDVRAAAAAARERRRALTPPDTAPGRR